MDILPPMTELDVLYADDALLVVNKPAGLLSVPGKGDGQWNNLTSQLQQRFANTLVVHRLDQATSGLMLFARQPGVQRSLSMAFEQRLVHKRYEAEVQGLVAEDKGVIDAPLAADWPRRPRQMVDLEKGKPSTTRWRVLQRHTHTTRLQLEPITGRSHQLRVHLLSVGHPIVGDTLYGQPGQPADGRLLLHATWLRFCHPVTQAELVFDSAAPF